MAKINWKDKKDSPELLAFLAQYGNEYYISAQEINEIKTAINQQATKANDGLSKGGYNGTGLSLSQEIASINEDLITRIDDATHEITEVLLTLKSDKSFRYSKTEDSIEWNVTHNLNKKPSVTITDNYGNEFEASVQHLDLNNLTITFSQPFSGFADLN